MTETADTMTETGKFALSWHTSKAKCLKGEMLFFSTSSIPYISLYKNSEDRKIPTPLKSAAIQPQGLKRVRTGGNGLVRTGCTQKKIRSFLGLREFTHGDFAHV